MAIVRMVGNVDGKEIIFSKDSGGFWSAAVPKDMKGEYIVEVLAYDEAGNVAYSASMIFIVDPFTLEVKMVPVQFASRVLNEGYKKKTAVSDYVYHVSGSHFKYKEISSNFTFRVVV